MSLSSMKWKDVVNVGDGNDCSLRELDPNEPQKVLVCLHLGNGENNQGI